MGRPARLKRKYRRRERQGTPVRHRLTAGRTGSVFGKRLRSRRPPK